MTTHLLYLHGFRSSPHSTKARQMAAWMAKHAPKVEWWCPQLPPSPAEAMALLTEGTARWPRHSMAVVGSSLGGFYATVLAEQRDCTAVLINPAVAPARDLARHIGEQLPWHSVEGEAAASFFFQPAFIDELRAMAPPQLTRMARYFAVLATGDEVLSWREMAQHCAGAHLRIVEGSDHALSDFAQHLPHVLHFLGLAPAP